MHKIHKTSVRLLCLLLTICLALNAAPLSAHALSDYGLSLISDMESKYTLRFVMENSRWDDDAHISELARALDAYPPGMVEQALDFYYMMSGTIPEVRLRSPSLRMPGTSGLTTRTAMYVITIDMMSTSSTAETFSHELAHLIHFYIMDSTGDQRLMALFPSLNGGNKYLGTDCFQSRYSDRVGVHFTSAYAMYSYEEDIAELVSMLCLEHGKSSEYHAKGPVTIQQKIIYTADELMRRTIRPANFMDSGDSGWWYETFSYTRFFDLIKPGLSDWAAAPVMEALWYNLLPPDDFLINQPKKSISRLHFSYLATRLIENLSGMSLHRVAEYVGKTNFFDRNSYKPYTDLPDTKRLDMSVNLHYLKELDIMKGTGDKLFSPDAALTRAQAAALFTNIAKLYNLYSAPSAVKYADAAEIPDWASDSVAFVTESGIMQGSGGRFLPNEALTYEQGITASLNMYKWILARSMITPAA